MPRHHGFQAADAAGWKRMQDRSAPCQPNGADRLKRGFDIVLASAIIVAFLPLYLIIFAALLAQGRPFLIQHVRVGRYGRTFPCLKFRTMVIEADAVLRRHLAEGIRVKTDHFV